MKILHLSAQDTSGGGGGFSASYRLHKNFLNAGYCSFMAVSKKISSDPNVFKVSHANKQVPISVSITKGIQSFTKKLKRSYFHKETKLNLSASDILHNIAVTPDIIIAHWVAGFVDAKVLYDLQRMTNAKVFWYFMDMAPMTGGCHYMQGCEEYMKECTSCPQLIINKSLSHRQWNHKKYYISKLNITAITGSTWQKEKLEKSSIFKNMKNIVIPLAIDSKIYCPGNREYARNLIGLPLDKYIIFVGAHNLNEYRKGMHKFIEALKIIKEKYEKNNVLVVTSGGQKPSIGDLFEHTHIGLLKGDIELSCAYQAADVFVCPSLEDAGPMMINESIMCGTPVVSFDMGIAKDLVITGKTGFKAKLNDERDLAKGIISMLKLDNNQLEVYQTNCRKYGLKYCSPDAQVRSFAKLF